VQVTITGLSATAANGGIVTITVAGSTPITVTIPASGSAQADVPAGTYQVSYAPPAGHVLAPGTSVPTSVTIVAGQLTAITVALVLSGFATPDILVNAGFESGWDGFKNFSSGDPNGATRAQDFAHTGQSSARFAWSPSGGDIGAEMAFSFSPADRLWVRFHFRVSSNVSTIWKFCRNRATGFGTLVGGLFVEDNTKIISWGFDAEMNAQTAGIGLTKAQVLDGNWHSIEYDYWRNGDPSGFPSVAFWFDGDPVSGSSAASPGSWQNGRLVAGQRGATVRVGMLQLMGTLNGGNSTSGQCNIDDFAISSVGRIGP